MSHPRGVFSKTRVELGPCECPGSPHPDGDWAEVKDRLLFGDVRRIVGHIFTDDMGGMTMALARAIVAWNLTDEMRKPLPIPVHDDNTTDLDALDVLSVEQSQLLRAVVDSAKYQVQLRGPSLPNPSSGPSADGSAEKSTPTDSTTSTAPTS